MRRNETCEGERSKWEKLYKEQKEEVQIIIKREIRKSEKKKAIAIRQDKSNGKNTFKYINMLRGEKERERVLLEDNVYGNDKKKIRKRQGKAGI